MITRNKKGMKALRALVLTGLSVAALTAGAQERRRAISTPTPVYPETAKRLLLSGVVKVRVVIGTDGQIKETKIIGGHPVFISTVEDALKKWKYAPSNTETTLQLEFNFHP
jgi:TonB family protein